MKAAVQYLEKVPQVPILELMQDKRKHFRVENLRLRKSQPLYPGIFDTIYLEDGDGPHLISSGKKQITVLSTGVSVVYKASTGGPIPPGTEVTYTFEIKSSANININNIVVKDSVLGDIGVIPVLSPGETATVSKAFKLESTTKVILSLFSRAQ